METNIKNPLSMHDVSRLAPAVVDVMQRNVGQPEFAAHATTMVPAANAVLVAIQDLALLKDEQAKLLAASVEQTGRLHGLLIRWSGALGHDIEGFDPGVFVRDPDQTFDVVLKATTFKRYLEQNGAGLPYQAALLTELTARLESTDRAARSAYTGRVAVQEKQREVRELSAIFYKKLISLRRTVRAVLGSTHVDHQRLRMPSRAAEEPALEEAPATEPSETAGRAASTAPSDGASRPSATG